ncbi:MAG: biopolymer transporter ExbD [Bradymonadaceae bacterium]
MFQKRRRNMASEASDINVVPVMNLFMVLIPFLLLGAAFYQIGVIPTSTATHDPHASDVPATPTTVAANLAIREDNIRLTFASTSLGEEALAEIAAEFPKKDGEYDVEGMQNHLLTIKERYPESTTMTVLPFEGLEYQALVEVLDAARERVKEGSDPMQPQYEELFPVTVFSKLLVADPAEGGDETDEEE